MNIKQILLSLLAVAALSFASTMYIANTSVSAMTEDERHQCSVDFNGAINRPPPPNPLFSRWEESHCNPSNNPDSLCTVRENELVGGTGGIIVTCPAPLADEPGQDGPAEFLPEGPNDCAGVATSIIGGDMCDDEDGPVFALLKWIVRFLTFGVGIAAVGGLVYGAVLYTTAGDKSEQTKKAIGVITNTVIGILMFGFMFALLNFLIPGGVFAAGLLNITGIG